MDTRAQIPGQSGLAEGEEPDAKLVATLVRDEVARRIAQVYCLERLAAGDCATARLVLSALAQVCGRRLRKRVGPRCLMSCALQASGEDGSWLVQPWPAGQRHAC